MLVFVTDARTTSTMKTGRKRKIGSIETDLPPGMKKNKGISVTISLDQFIQQKQKYSFICYVFVRVYHLSEILV